MVLSLTQIISFLVDWLIIVFLFFLSSSRPFAIPTTNIFKIVMPIPSMQMTSIKTVRYLNNKIYITITYNEKLVTDSSSVVTVGRKKLFRIIPRFAGYRGCIPSAFRFLDLFAGKNAGSGFDKG